MFQSQEITTFLPTNFLDGVFDENSRRVNRHVSESGYPALLALVFVEISIF